MKYKPVSALLKGLSMLELTASSKQGCSLNELAGAAGCSAAAAHHLAHTLLETGYLRRDDKTLRFYPGSRINQLSGSSEEFPLEENLSRLLIKLHQVFSDFSIYFCSAEGSDVFVHQHIISGKRQKLKDSHYPLPPYTSVGGMMHLAFAGEQFCREYYLRHNFNAYGGVLWASMDSLMGEIEVVQERGYFFLPTKNRQQIRAGLPLFDSLGGFIGSLTFSCNLPDGSSPAPVRKRLIQQGTAIINEIFPVK